MRVTVLGLGSMGSALAGALLDKGVETTVWNRSAGRAAPLVARGAREAATPLEAVEGRRRGDRLRPRLRRGAGGCWSP
ncbi:NAD(P)-binding domain-containing protein [Nonomuraea dietziae]|uniref:NAD(P)-binding domain-containing protein n=1 Tax=Nonomuraea dietziae TaxID=65515 RepID=UPI0031D5FF20